MEISHILRCFAYDCNDTCINTSYFVLLLSGKYPIQSMIGCRDLSSYKKLGFNSVRCCESRLITCSTLSFVVLLLPLIQLQAMMYDYERQKI